MRFPHLFEFMDQAWVPRSIRTTLLEMQHFGDSPPFRRYNHWVADEAIAAAQAAGATTIVELGAGAAPVTQLLADDPRTDGLRLVVCDLAPENDIYRDLQRQYPAKVEAIYEPVDISQPRRWSPGTLLVLSDTFHHLPPDQRPTVVRALTESADRVVITESVRKRPSSIVLCLLSIVPSLLLPIGLWRRPGRLRRVLWCWLVPIGPLMFCWEGVVSCLRQWSNREWDAELRRALAGQDRPWTIRSWLFCQLVTW
jgi:hypothetical protein